MYKESKYLYHIVYVNFNNIDIYIYIYIYIYIIYSL